MQSSRFLWNSTVSTKLMICLLIIFPFQFTFAAPLKLNLNWKPEPQFGGFYQAELDQLFQKNKLDVKIFTGGSGTPTVQMLQNKQTDFAIVSAEEILLANQRDPQKPVVAVFAVFQKNPQIIMARKDSQLGSIREILQSPGVLAVQRGLSYFQFLEKKWGVPKAKIVPYQGGIGVFLQEKNYSQQGFATSEPILSEKAGVPAKVFAIADEGFNPYTTVVAVRAEDLKTKKTTMISMVKAIRAGWQAYLKSPEKANRYMKKLNPSMDESTFKQSADIQIPYIRSSEGAELGAMTLERWTQLHDQLMELKILTNKQNLSGVFLNL